MANNLLPASVTSYATAPQRQLLRSLDGMNSGSFISCPHVRYGWSRLTAALWFDGSRHDAVKAKECPRGIGSQRVVLVGGREQN